MGAFMSDHLSMQSPSRVHCLRVGVLSYGPLSYAACQLTLPHQGIREMMIEPTEEAVQSRLALAIFAYKRPDHLRQTLAALANNNGINDWDIYFFLDGPRTAEDEQAVQEVRDVIEASSFFPRCKIRAESSNRGLYSAITKGVSYVLSRHESVVVLEEDIVTASSFLDYMRTSLELYRDEAAVGSIHGYLPPFRNNAFPETFFLRGADCWGWATWRDRWECFREDASQMLREIESQGLAYHFNLLGNYPFTDLLAARASGQSGSWAICWHASCYLAGLHALYPGRSLVENIGLDNSGEHCQPSPMMASTAASQPIRVSKVPVEELPWVHSTYSEYFSSANRRTNRLKRLVKLLYGQSQSVGRRVLGLCRRLYRRKPALLRPTIGISILHLNGPYPDYETALLHSQGYDSSVVLEKVQQGVLAVLNGKAEYERDGTAFDKAPEILHLNILLRSLLNVGDTVVDFGGGLGGLFINNPSLFEPCSRRIVVEQDSFVRAGQKLCGEYSLSIEFLNSLSLLESVPDVLILSGVLPYLSDPFLVLDEVAKLKPKAIIVDRTAITDSSTLQWFVQENPGYYREPVSYPIVPIPVQPLIDRLVGYKLSKTWTNSFDAEIPPHGGFYFHRES